MKTNGEWMAKRSHRSVCRRHRTIQLRGCMGYFLWRSHVLTNSQHLVSFLFLSKDIKCAYNIHTHTHEKSNGKHLQFDHQLWNHWLRTPFSRSPFINDIREMALFKQTQSIQIEVCSMSFTKLNWQFSQFKLELNHFLAFKWAHSFAFFLHSLQIFRSRLMKTFSYCLAKKSYCYVRFFHAANANTQCLVD